MRCKLAARLVLVLLLVPRASWADYIRDKVHVHLRAGPSLEYRILKMLESGDALARLSESEDWIQVRTDDGETGWIPDGYLVSEAPASVALPQVQAQLSQAQARIGELDAKLASQQKLLDESEGLRKRNAELEDENARIGAASTWKSLATGAAIILVGALIGMLIPRGGVSRTRLKL
jgi:SH3 domain protein